MSLAFNKLIVKILSDEPIPLTIHASLGYRNKGDPDNAWKYYAGSVEERVIDCQVDVCFYPFFFP